MDLNMRVSFGGSSGRGCARPAFTEFEVTADMLTHDRRLQALLRLWEERRGSRSMPARKDFSMEDLAPWFGNLTIVDVVCSGRDFRWRLFGTTIAREAGFDMTGRLLSEYPLPEMIPVFAEIYAGILACKRPAYGEHRPGVENVALRRRLLLPLSSDGESVDMIMSCNYTVEIVLPVGGYL